MCVEDIKDLHIQSLDDVVNWVIREDSVIKSKDMVEKIKESLNKSLSSLLNITDNIVERTYYGYKCSKNMVYTLKYILSDNKIESFVYYNEYDKKCYKITSDKWGTGFYLENYHYTIIR